MSFNSLNSSFTSFTCATPSAGTLIYTSILLYLTAISSKSSAKWSISLFGIEGVIVISTLIAPFAEIYCKLVDISEVYVIAEVKSKLNPVSPLKFDIASCNS